MIHSILYHHL